MFDNNSTKNQNQGGETEEKNDSPATGQSADEAGATEEKVPQQQDPKKIGVTEEQTGAEDKEIKIDKDRIRASREAIKDIFADTDKENSSPSELKTPSTLEKPAVFKPKENLASAEGDDARKSNKKIIVLAVMIVGIGVVGYGAYWGMNNLLNESETVEPTVLEPKDEPKITPEPKDEPEDTGEERENLNEEELIDSDQDGLSDAEEKALNMDIENVDSDSDGLFDREEVKVYKTNPLNPDTDGDTFLDGAEVEAGYNPNGPGRLYEIKK